VGELIENLGKIQIGNSDVDIELNGGTSIINRNNSIHLQNEDGRLEMSVEDFILVVLSLSSCKKFL
jgi:hypothetical protein